MSVSSILQLKDQPANGTAEYIPLGGDGWTSPQSVWMIDSEVTGDATGGTNTISVVRDERFSNICPFMMIQTDGGSVLALFRLFVGSPVRAAHVGPTIASATESFLMWIPPLVMASRSWSVQVPNVDTEVIKFKLNIYNYRIRAPEEVPLDKLLASMPSSAAAL